MKEKLICGLTTDEIDDLRKKHGYLVLGTIKQGEKKYQAIFKEPSTETLKASGSIGKTDEVQGTLTLYNNCKVVVDPEIEKRDFLKMKSVECLAEHMNSFKVEVKNL